MEFTAGIGLFNSSPRTLDLRVNTAPTGGTWSMPFPSAIGENGRKAAMYSDAIPYTITVTAKEYLNGETVVIPIEFSELEGKVLVGYPPPKDGGLEFEVSFKQDSATSGAVAIAFST